jgi:hypothetical protein
MASNDSADSTAREAEERVERAKASLLARLEVLKDKVTEVKGKVDLRAQIEKHPLPAVGIAFALGALAGLRRTSTAATGAYAHPLASTAIAGLAALGLRLLREVALSQLGNLAKQWWVEREGVSAREERGSHMADIEPFLEH